MRGVVRRFAPGLGLVVSLVALVAAVILGVQHGAPRPSLGEQVDQVAATLRCPTCEAESVAASNAPIARSMRSEIRAQLSAGRSPDQIRSWFRQRYGERVLLIPDSGGPGLVLWVVPAAVLLGGVVVWLLVARRRRPVRGVAGPRPSTAGIAPVRLAVAGCACVVVAVAVPVLVNGSAATPRVSATSAPDEATAPLSAAQRTRTALDLLEEGHPRAAIPLVRRTAASAGPQRAMAMLVLGLAERALHREAARTELRSFLRQFPHHPAADQVRRLLREDR
ncbi:cytochrome c-type biogenesis protein [Nocardioides terrisoli]|uniref:cytochrome c-type biogenesis protein n=1 Tax=Nocardioides terrisoli TaxID=3388267 RepID=UPI00287BC804|nr:cytochrome c-type biogenesis protein [Nocardioides marmorisolisilvae]